MEGIVPIEGICAGGKRARKKDCSAEVNVVKVEKNRFFDIEHNTDIILLLTNGQCDRTLCTFILGLEMLSGQ